MSSLRSLLQPLLCITNAVEIKACPGDRRLRVTDSPVRSRACARALGVRMPRDFPVETTMPHRLASSCCMRAPVPFEKEGEGRAFVYATGKPYLWPDNLNSDWQK